MQQSWKETFVNGPNFITLDVGQNGAVSLQSNLASAHQGDALYNAAIDGLEAKILSDASVGVDVRSQAYQKGIWAALEGINNHF